jgi:hypothetical protein
MPNITIRQIANGGAYVVMLVVNYLSVSIPIGGVTTAEIANRYPIYFLPASFTFSVWGVIYAALGLFIVEQFRRKRRDDPRLRRIGWLFVVSCLANSAWLILFQNLLFVLSLVAMLVLLVTLIMIYRRLEIGRPTVRRGRAGAREATWTRWSIQVPFSLYLAWISVATITNASYVLYVLGWNGFGLSGQVWAIVMLVVAAVLTLVVVADRRDIAYTLVVVWAFLGIAARQSGVAPAVAATAEVLAGLLALALTLRYLWPRSRWVVPHGHLEAQS